MEAEEEPEEADSVLGVQGVHLPVNVGEGVLEESSDVLEGSPLLGHVTGLSCGHNELVEVTIGLLSESSIVGLSLGYVIYLPIMSALSLMLGTPCMRPWIPEILCLKWDLGLSRSYRYSVIFSLLYLL